MGAAATQCRRAGDHRARVLDRVDMIRPSRQLARIGLGTLARRRLKLWDPGWAYRRRPGAWPADQSAVEQGGQLTILAGLLR